MHISFERESGDTISGISQALETVLKVLSYGLLLVFLH